MKSVIYHFDGSWNKAFDKHLDSENTLVLVFGCSDLAFLSLPLRELKQCFTKSILLGASTAGEIFQDKLFENTLIVAVLKFHSTRLKFVSVSIDDSPQSFQKGVDIAKALYTETLNSMLVLSDGLQVNGSQLTVGINSVVGSKVSVSGGMAGDSDRFKKTWVLVDGVPQQGFISAVGFYGDNIQVLHGSRGGWDRLGLERIVTRSEDNVLFEVDYQPALDLYKRYLGEKSRDLPASGLLFPLQIEDKEHPEQFKVRTILAVNEHENSITFAGDIPEGSRVTLMKANFDRLIDGASEAAEQINCKNLNNADMLCLAISCVGRKLVLKQRTEEELEAVLDALPKNTRQVGFYSYGEISPLSSGCCDLHNQTMTLTLISEKDAPLT